MKLVLKQFAWIGHLPRWCERVLTLLLIWFGIGLAWFILTPAAGLGNLSMPAALQTRKQDTTALRSWFEVASTPAQAAAPVDDLRLIAVIAGKQGVALLGGAEASTVAVRAGSEIKPGARLLEVRADRIVIERGGQRQELALPASTPVGVSVVAATPAAPAEPVRAPTATNKLSRGQFSSAIQGGNLGSWDKGLASAPDGGILVENAAIQPLSKFLKLENGDVLIKVDGRQLAQLADISLVYNAFSQRDTVELTVLRNNTLQSLRYQIKP